MNVLFQNYQGGATIKVKQTDYYCTLCKFRGVSRKELAKHRKRTIHNKCGEPITASQVCRDFSSLCHLRPPSSAAS